MMAYDAEDDGANPWTRAEGFLKTSLAIVRRVTNGNNPVLVAAVMREAGEGWRYRDLCDDLEIINESLVKIEFAILHGTNPGELDLREREHLEENMTCEEITAADEASDGACASVEELKNR